MGLLVGNGRLYKRHRYGPGGTRLGVNTVDVTIDDDSGEVAKTSLKRNSGALTGEGADAERELSRKPQPFIDSCAGNFTVD